MRSKFKEIQEPSYIGHSEPQKLTSASDTIHIIKVIDSMINHNIRHVSLLVMVEDFAEDPGFSGHGKSLQAFCKR